jgi:hypothetical protein
MYEYVETPNKSTPPEGEGWEYWSDRVILDEQGKEVERVAVWRRPESGVWPESS